MLFIRLEDCRLAPSNPSLQRPVAFPPVVLQMLVAFSSFRGSAQSAFFPVPRLPPGPSNPSLHRGSATFRRLLPGPFKPFPAASSGLSTCCLANANGFSSCRGSAQSYFPVPRLPPGPFKPFPASSGLATCCLAIFQIKCQWLFQFLPHQMPVAFPVGDLHRALFKCNSGLRAQNGTHCLYHVSCGSNHKKGVGGTRALAHSIKKSVLSVLFH